MFDHAGKERWPPKIGTDAGAALVDIAHPVPITVAELRALPAPHSPPQDARLPGPESTCYEVTCMLVMAHVEADGDYHCVLSDVVGDTMIGEIPDPTLLDTRSCWRLEIERARQAFDAAWGPPHGWKVIHVQVTITGPAFFDHLHGQAGVAPNGVEIHPILSLRVSR